MTATSIPSVREWARTNGYTIADRGRIAPEIHSAYRAAHPELVQDRPSNSATCHKCKRVWTAARECHCPICHRQFSTVRWFDDHRKGMGPRDCIDPATIPTSAKDNTPKYKVVESAWGELIVLATERPESFDAELF